jgi:twinkle protein
MVNELREIGIDTRGRTSGLVKLKCPECTPHKRKPQNRNATDLSVNIDDGTYKCHNCDWKGGVGKGFINDTTHVTYSLPNPNDIKAITNSAEQYLMGRGISRKVILSNKIGCDSYGNVTFPYYFNESLVNTKTRFLDKKSFRQSAGARPVMFNYDRAKLSKIIIVTEGEIDSMSWEEAGYEYATSVNQGAPNENDSNYDKKLKCIDECLDMFENAEKIYLSADNDDNGRLLNSELVRRFGDKCMKIDFGNFKDANQVLMESGADTLREMYETAKEIKIDGVFYVEDVEEQMIRNFKNGKTRGSTTHTPIDPAWTWMPGELNMWTGYNNEGKSFFLEWLSVIKAWYDGWNFAFFSPENFPIENFFDELVEIFIGKSCDRYYRGHSTIEVMSEDEYKKGLEFVKEHFFAIYPSNDFSLDTLFEKADYLIKKKGIRGFVIDPYNWVEHMMRPGEREDLYISRFMTRLKNFTSERGLSTHLVAHQTTPSKDSTGYYPCPSKYTIKGGGTFADKTDNLVGVWRPYMAQDKLDTRVVFFSEKIKKQRLVGLPQKMGETDGTDIRFNRPTSRYLFNGEDPMRNIDQSRIEQVGLIKNVGMQANLSFDEEDHDNPF